MQKKHGIIVGVTILIVALSITLISSAIKQKGGVEKQPPLAASEIDNSTTSNGDSVKPDKGSIGSDTVQGSQNNSGGNTGVDVTEPGVVTNNGTTTNIDNNSIFEVAEDIVLNPTSEVNEVMLVSSKKIMLIDMAVNSKDNKQMVYVIDMLTADSKKVSLYVNGVVYNDINVGDTLNIQYNKYVNKNGVEIPLVIQATKTTK